MYILQGGFPYVGTNIELDEKFVKEAMKFTGKKTKKDVVNFAIE